MESRTVGDILNLKKIRHQLEELLDNMYIKPSGKISNIEYTFLGLVNKYYKQFEPELKPYITRYIKMVDGVAEKWD